MTAKTTPTEAPSEQIAIPGDIYFKAADGTVKVWGNNPDVLGENPNDEDRTKPTVVGKPAALLVLAGLGAPNCITRRESSKPFALER